MAKRWHLMPLLAFAICISLLSGAGAYAGTSDLAFDVYQPIADFVPLVADVDTADGADATDLQKDITAETDRDEPGRYRDLQRHSKPATDSQTATLTVHRLKYEVPWQYLQA